MSGKALMVGINAYPKAPLAGCLNDLKNMRPKIDNRGLEICVLQDHEATTANILEKLNWLVDVKPGDTVFFHYSGHGAQAATGDNSEPDGLAETICPVDFDWTPQRMITDKQFVQIFSRIPQGAIFNWVSDSCHSGGLSRDIGSIMIPKKFWGKVWDKVAFWNKNPKIMPRSMPIPPHMLLKIGIAKQKGMKCRGMLNGLLDVGFVSGCKSNQTSADTYINGEACGAATTHFLKALESNPNAPLSTVVAQAVKSLQTDGYSQVPQAEGARSDRPFLMP